MLRHGREKKNRCKSTCFPRLKNTGTHRHNKVDHQEVSCSIRRTRDTMAEASACGDSMRSPAARPRRSPARCCKPQRPTGPHVRGTTPQSPLQVNFSGLGDGESTMPCLPPARAHPSQSLQKLNPRAIAATHLSPRSGSAAWYFFLPRRCCPTIAVDDDGKDVRERACSLRVSSCEAETRKLPRSDPIPRPRESKRGAQVHDRLASLFGCALAIDAEGGRVHARTVSGSRRTDSSTVKLDRPGGLQLPCGAAVVQ